MALLTENKGIPDLLRAVAELPAGRATLDLVGDGPERTRYEALARRLRLGDRVRFHGIKPPREVARFMRESDLFVLASHTENNPCVLLEAMACGLPIVATAVGGVPEIVHERAGALVPPRAPAELAAALARAIDDLARFDRAAIARDAEATYGHRVMGERWLSTYRRVVAAAS